MTDNEFDKKQSDEKLPEDFRPVIPEPEIHRRAIIGFHKNYPVQENPTSTHTESFAQQEFKRKVRRNIIYAVALLITFIAAFIITDACIKISTEPLPTTTTVATQPPSTQPPTEPPAEESSADISEENSEFFN